MPNQVTADGLETATQSELIGQLTSALQTIYGGDIDLDPETPDGQWINIIVQLCLDLEDLVTQVYNMFDPDNAIGNVLDQRVAINGIQRQAGTFTITNVTLTTSQSVNLPGLDQTQVPPYTVADAAGNQYQLIISANGFNPGSGGSALSFQAANPGAITPTPNTITIPVTIILGVTSVNNPTAASSIGLNEETDAALRIRRQQSVSLASQGYLAGLLAALENISGVTAAFVYENNTNETDSDGVPSHSIWAIVNGGAAVDIANAIYTKRNAGCGMFGQNTYPITQVDGSIFTVAWDSVISQGLFTIFNVSSINGTNVPNIAAIRAGLVTSFVPGVFAEVNINELATLVQQIDPNSLVTNSGFTALWDDETTYQIGDVVSYLGVLYTAIADNLDETPPNATYWSVTGSYANILQPFTKNRQFSVSAPYIVILPMIISPSNGGQVTVQGGSVVSTASVVHGGNTLDFSTLGGYGTDGSGSGTPPPANLTYSIQSSTGGGSSINATTGVYTSGAAGTDVVLVTDLLGNTAICTVTVT